MEMKQVRALYHPAVTLAIAEGATKPECCLTLFALVGGIDLI